MSYNKVGQKVNPAIPKKKIELIKFISGKKLLAQIDEYRKQNS